MKDGTPSYLLEGSAFLTVPRQSLLNVVRGLDHGGAINSKEFVSSFDALRLSFTQEELTNY